MCIETAVNGGDSADTLHILARTYAAAAKDAFIVITNDEGCAFILFHMVNLACKVSFVCYAVVAAESLELAILASDAGKAFLFVCGKNKLEVCFSHCLYFFCICENFHSLCNGSYASSHQAASALNLNESKAASADLVDVLKVAKCGDLNFCDSRCIEDCGIRGNGIFTSVDFYVYIFLCYISPPQPL